MWSPLLSVSFCRYLLGRFVDIFGVLHLKQNEKGTLVTLLFTIFRLQYSMKDKNLLFIFLTRGVGISYKSKKT